MIQCPFCDGQGVINKATIVLTNQTIYICDECDTMWTAEDIQENNSKRFRDHMNELGLKGLWSELTNVTSDW
jgi:uncharacterized Zn ribbon protein